MNLVVFNARVLSSEGRYSGATAVGVQGGKIAFVGSDAELKERAAADTPTMDLGQRTLMAGFGDAHVHIWKIGQLLTSVLDLRGVDSIGAIQARLAEVADQTEPGQWILARGFNEATLAEGMLPDHHDLDLVSTEHPIWMIRTCAHIAVANRAAMRAANISASTAAPEGGVIDRWEDGSPSGVFRETALELVQQVIPKPTDAQRKEFIRRGGQRLVEQGVTFACDPGVDEQLLAAYHALEQRGELPLRCQVMTLGSDEGTASADIPAPYASDTLQIDTAKFFLDGGLSGATAAISQPYRDSDSTGVLRMEAEQFAAAARPWVEAGYRVAVHAIGDVAIEVALKAYAELKLLAPTRRHRIEHCGLPQKQHLVKARELGVMIVPQAIFVRELGRSFRTYLPDDFGVTPYPLQSILDAGLTMALSTDGPVVRELNPWAGIQAAITRQDADGFVHDARESITLGEALAAYTIGSAAVCRLDACGQITPGMHADFVVPGEDPLNCPIEKLHEIPVDLTMINGRVVYER